MSPASLEHMQSSRRYADMAAAECKSGLQQDSVIINFIRFHKFILVPERSWLSDVVGIFVYFCELSCWQLLTETNREETSIMHRIKGSGNRVV